MPEYRNTPNPAYQNERVRGTGGFNITSFGEENLLNLAGDRYDDESIGLHEFCHTVDSALAKMDPSWPKTARADLSQRGEQGVVEERLHRVQTSRNIGRRFGQSYFDCNRINNWNHAPIATREQLKLYDPEGYELVKTVFNLTPENDFKYTPIRKQPSVIPPPAKFKIDPYYTKFTFAREFPVIGSARVSDEA